MDCVPADGASLQSIMQNIAIVVAAGGAVVAAVKSWMNSLSIFETEKSLRSIERAMTGKRSAPTRKR